MKISKQLKLLRCTVQTKFNKCSKIGSIKNRLKFTIIYDFCNILALAVFNSKSSIYNVLKMSIAINAVFFY